MTWDEPKHVRIVFIRCSDVAPSISITHRSQDMSRLPASLADSLPLLLKSRPQRQIIEKKRHEKKVISSEPDQVSPYFITVCEHCSFDFENMRRIAQITVEDCEDLQLYLCPVIASTELVKCEDIHVYIAQTRGTISLDMSKNVNLHLKSDKIEDDLVIYTSSCDSVTLHMSDGRTYVLPKRDIIKQGRYRTSIKAEVWATHKCNLYGDVIEDET